MLRNSEALTVPGACRAPRFYLRDAARCKFLRQRDEIAHGAASAVD